jgi:hypothetical protein
MEKIELLIERAKEGDVVAQGELGAHYYQAGDYEKAFSLLSSAALHREEIECEDGDTYVEYTGGDDWATYWLGECYLHGLGVEQDVDKAIELWEAAADFSDGVIIELGYLYSKGEMIEPDYKRAAYWWGRALDYYGEEENSQPVAQYELGMCYYYGKGVEKDEAQALRYLELFIDSCDRIGLSFTDSKHKKEWRVKLRESVRLVKTLRDELDSRSKAAVEHPRTIVVKEVALREPPVEISVGEVVIHKSFGEGVVSEVIDGYIYVNFAVGNKKFLNPEAFHGGFLNIKR